MFVGWWWVLGREGGDGGVSLGGWGDGERGCGSWMCGAGIRDGRIGVMVVSWGFGWMGWNEEG